MKETGPLWFKGMKIDNISYSEAVARIDSGIQSGGYVCFVEANSVVVGSRNSQLMSALNNSTMSLPDGMPLVWYGRLLGSHKIQRMSGPEVFRDFIERRIDYKHFLLGDTPETIREVICRAKARNPLLDVTGYSPPYRSVLTQEDNQVILDRINRASPDIIWVALGMIKQAIWMYNMAPRIKRGIMMGIGAAFRFYTGAIPTPPSIMQRMGLQWVSRFFDRRELFFKEVLPHRALFFCYFPAEVIRARVKARTVTSGNCR